VDASQYCDSAVVGVRRALGLCEYDKCAPVLATHVLYFGRPCGCFHVEVNRDSPMCELHMNKFRHPSWQSRVNPTKCRVCGQVNKVQLIRVEKIG
jgi:hypothetical protein